MWQGVTLASQTNAPFTVSGNINAIAVSDAGGTSSIGLALNAYDATTHGLINWSLSNTGSINGGEYGVDFHVHGHRSRIFALRHGAFSDLQPGQWEIYGTGVGFFQSGVRW